MKLETKRLILIPLNEYQLLKYVINNGDLERELNVEVSERVVAERVVNAIQSKILPAMSDVSKNQLYYTFWTIIDKQLNRMVGDMCFKGEPNEKGEIEIGYGTYSDFRNKGYMTEAVNEIIKWALEQNGVETVLAQTDPNNSASHKVLEKNKFEIYDQVINNMFWRLKKT
jgi:[ribosomal protein S5]-alanine N-acetyltransferase